MSTQAGKTLSLPRVDILILGLLLAATGIAYGLHWSFTIDDAAISFSYARNFAEGYGLGALYPGAPRVEGYSNFLWVVLLALGTKIGLETVLVSKVLGLVFSLGIAGLLFFSVRSFVQQSWMLLGLLLLPLSLTFSFWSASGLENSLYGFLIIMSVFFLLAEERREITDPDRWMIPLGSALSLVLVGMTRPEGLVYALAGLAYKVLQIIFSRGDHQKENTEAKAFTSKRIRSLMVWLIIFAIGYGLFKVWHYLYFAAWWPNPIYAKAGWQRTDLKQIWFNPAGWVYVRGYFRTFAGIWTLPMLLFGGLVSMRGPQRVFPLFALAALVLPLYTPDWMLNYRFVYPFVPLSVALLVLAADQLWAWMWAGVAKIFVANGARDPALHAQADAQKPSHAKGYLLLGVGLLTAILFAYGVARFAWANLRLTQVQLECGYAPMAETRCLNGRMYWTLGEVEAKYTEIANFAAQLGLDDPLYMIPDIGATSYVKDFRILDLAGLADFHLARIRQGTVLKQFLFEEQRPELIQTSGVWTRRTDLTTFQDFRQAYLPIEQGQDAEGVIHGTFVRKDLIIDALSTETSTGGIQGTELAPGIKLVKTDIQPVANPGQTIEFDTFWVVEQELSQNAPGESSASQNGDWVLWARLVDENGEMILEDQRQLGYGWYPISSWIPGEVFRQHSKVVLDVPEGQYTMAISLLPVEHTPGKVPDELGLSFQHQLIISESAAQALEDQLNRRLNQEIAVGNTLAARETLQQLANISPGGADQQVDNSQAKMLIMAGLLEQARLDYQQGEFELMMEVIRQAAKINLRAQPNAEWRKFSQELQAAAEERAYGTASKSEFQGNSAAVNDDRLKEETSLKEAYLLSLAASLADPSNTWAQRSLEKLRRLYLLGAASAG